MRLLRIAMIIGPIILVLAARSERASAASGDCTMVNENILLRSGVHRFPASGNIVVESHLATIEDEFPNNALFPTSADESIEAHLHRSCEALKLALPLKDCADIYRAPWSRLWTPAEGTGRFGQGSVGNRRPSVTDELWGANLNWGRAARPPPGTRFLVSHMDRNVVVVMGYESGPTSARILAGLQSEVAWALSLRNGDIVNLGRLVDQDIALGPITCASPVPRHDK